MAITLSQLIDHHDRELKDAVEKTKDKPQSNIEQMIWNFHYTRLEFHAQALALLRSIRPGLGHRIPFTREQVDAIDKGLSEKAKVLSQTVSCPVCAAAPGNECETPSGQSHIRRRRKAASNKQQCLLHAESCVCPGCVYNRKASPK